MIFKLFKTASQIEKERRAKYCEWHDHFVWFPTHLGYEDGQSVWAWLEIIERRGSHCWDDYRNMPEWWNYRVKEKQ